MSYQLTIVCYIILQSFTTPLQINLYRTDSSSYQSLQHHCLDIRAPLYEDYDPRQINSYCLTHPLSQELIHDFIHDQPYFSFEQLAQLNITSRQLYLWSASIDLIEQYQDYLNQPSSTRNHSINNQDQVFYNCTWPNFGPLCQFSFDHLSSSSTLSPFPTTLTAMVHDFYIDHPYQPTTFTCYEHLKCNRGSTSGCLDWTEICDGKMDCLDTGADEEHCWQLEVNECAEDEYQCANGQCIPKAFLRDRNGPPDCLDRSDYDQTSIPIGPVLCPQTMPLLECEDISCPLTTGSHLPVLSSSCYEYRTKLMIQELYSMRPDGFSNECWLPLRCALILPGTPACNETLDYFELRNRIMKHCPGEIWLIPPAPVLFGHVYYAYRRSDAHQMGFGFSPGLICVDESFCGMLHSSHESVRHENLKCYPRSALTLSAPITPYWMSDPHFVSLTFRRFATCNNMPLNYYNHCAHSQLYQCLNSSKCVPRYRLLDSKIDCFYGDDEQLDHITKYLSIDLDRYFFRCGDTHVYIAHRLVADGSCHCPWDPNDKCPDEDADFYHSQHHLSFQTVCDGFIDLSPVVVDEQMMNDETDCEYWLCNNVYTRCDNIWNCPDGSDENNCDNRSFSIRCGSDQTECLLPETNQVICLSVNKINDGHVDCLGGTDEPQICRMHHFSEKKDGFYCRNASERSCIGIDYLCDGYEHCLHGDDEQFCHPGNMTSSFYSFCHASTPSEWSDIQNHICRRFSYSYRPSIVYFSLIDRTTYNQHQQQQSKIPVMHSSLPSISSRSNSEPYSYQPPCHRGLPLRARIQHNLTYPSSIDNISNTLCLCPPSFYGSLCQYQNQRITLTLQFRALSDSWQTLFAIIIVLVHHHPITHKTYVHSSQQFTYLPMRDCQMKFHHYLLYALRPADLSLNYSVLIHIYDKTSLTHRSTYLIPVLFPFLPVYRLALQIDIPSARLESSSSHHDSICSTVNCGSHGRCIPYSYIHPTRRPIDKQRQWFCQCDRGWSGQYCAIPSICSCSPDSLCLDTLINGRSICLCPPQKFGDRCFIDNHICHDHINGTKICLHGGRCLPHHDQHTSHSSFTCLCPKGYTGDRCEVRQTEIIFSFDTSSLIIPESMLIHFIRYHRDRQHENITIIKTIPLNEEVVTVYSSYPFHLIFIELYHHQYYLAIMQKAVSSLNQTLTKTVGSSDRCPHIRELFNHTLLSYHPLRRIKYYHLLCQRRSSPSSKSWLSCFYDDDHLCLCDDFDGRVRHANCFEFNHEMKLDCMGQNGCENGARCFQDHPTCPQTSMCVCQNCFYGRRCQFSMSGFSLSLDGILGYHIRPYLSFRYQSLLVQTSLVLTVIMVAIGLLNGICALVTFKNKKTSETGCGYYLLGSSCTTLVTMVIFLLKYLILYSAQTGQIRNRSFLRVQCMSIDYLLRACLNMDQWLNACVAFERILTIVQGPSFDRVKSRRNARYIMVGVLAGVLLSNMYDPLHRHLIEDNNQEEDRIWCVASYPSWLRSLDSAVNMIHFGIPFLVNIVSALVIIFQNGRRKLTIQSRLSFQIVLRDQLRQHKYLFITPVLIIGLSCPRLIISIISGCMQSGQSSWVFLAGYLVSFLPPMLTFLLFVIPSDLYMREFLQTVKSHSRRLKAWIFQK